MADRRYPLHWPEGWPRTPAHKRRKSAYTVSETSAREDLLHSLRLMGGSKVILSTNVELRLDGLPYANRRAPVDPGVAVYWTRNAVEESMAIDIHPTVRENYRAIGQAIDALRQLDRCGAPEVLKRAFTGFAALPEKASESSWRAVMGFGSRDGITSIDVLERFRKLSKVAHPDAGGTSEFFIRLCQARDAALQEVPRG